MASTPLHKSELDQELFLGSLKNLKNTLKIHLVYKVHFEFKFYFMHMGILPACVRMYRLCAWYLRKPEEYKEFPVSGATGGCEQ